MAGAGPLGPRNDQGTEIAITETNAKITRAVLPLFSIEFAQN
jgi:hypothetical protein